MDLPKQGPAASAKTFPEQAEDTRVNNIFTCLDTMDCEDAVPDVPNSPSLATFLNMLPDLSMWQRAAAQSRKR